MVPSAEQESTEWAEQLVSELTERLERTIKESGYRYQFISTKAGMRESWVSDLLAGWRGKRRGRAPSIETLLLLARGLGTTLGELLGPDILLEPRPAGGAGPRPGEVVRNG